MPHLLLEYSANVIDPVKPQELLPELHQLFASFESITLSQIKSRAVRHADYYVGDGDAKNAFVYLQCSLLDGRPENLRKTIGEALLKHLASKFPRSLRELNLSLTVEMREMARSTHFKHA